MTWPSSDVNNTNTSSGSTAGQPAAARLDIRDLITKFNEMRNHVSTFWRGVLDDTTASDAQTSLGGTTVGKAVFTAASESAARTATSSAQSGSNADITALTAISDARWSLRLATNTTQSSGQNAVIFSTEDEDFGGAYNSGTGTWTAPAAGVYAFTYLISVQGQTWTSSVPMTASLWSPSTSRAYGFSTCFVTTSAPYSAPILQATLTLYVASGQTFYVEMNNGTGGNVTLTGAALGSRRSYWHINRLS